MDNWNKYYKANEFERESGLESAVEFYEEEVSEDRNDSESFERLAFVYRDRGDIHHEIRVLEKGLSYYEKRVFLEHIGTELVNYNQFCARLKAARKEADCLV